MSDIIEKNPFDALLGNFMFNTCVRTQAAIEHRYSLLKTLWRAGRSPAISTEETILYFHIIQRATELRARTSLVYIDDNDDDDDDIKYERIVPVEPSASLARTLFVHQSLAVRYFLYMEKQQLENAARDVNTQKIVMVYCDPVGSGKTYSIVSLCATAAGRSAHSFNIIIVPHKLCSQWCESLAAFEIDTMDAQQIDADNFKDEPVATKMSPAFVVKKSKDAFGPAYVRYASVVAHGIVILPSTLVCSSTLRDLVDARKNFALCPFVTRLFIDEIDTIRLKSNRVPIERVATFIYYISATFVRYGEIQGNSRCPRFECTLPLVRVKTNVNILRTEAALTMSNLYQIKHVVLPQPITYLPFPIDSEIIYLVNNEFSQGDNTRLVNLLLERQLIRRDNLLREIRVYESSIAASVTGATTETLAPPPNKIRRLMVAVERGAASTSSSSTASSSATPTTIDPATQIVNTMKEEVERRRRAVEVIDSNVDYMRQTILTDNCIICLESTSEFLLYVCCKAKVCARCAKEYRQCPICRLPTKPIMFASNESDFFKRQSLPTKRARLATLLTQIDAECPNAKIIVFVATSIANFEQDYLRDKNLRAVFWRLGGVYLRGAASRCKRNLVRFNSTDDRSVRLVVATGISSCAGFDLGAATHLIICNLLKSTAVEEQIIGRGLRPNRPSVLNVYKLFYQSELTESIEHKHLSDFILRSDSEGPWETDFKLVTLSHAETNPIAGTATMTVSDSIASLWNRYKFVYTGDN